MQAPGKKTTTNEQSDILGQPSFSPQAFVHALLVDSVYFSFAPGQDLATSSEIGLCLSYG